MYRFRSVGDKRRLIAMKRCHQHIMELLRLYRQAERRGQFEAIAQIEARIRYYQNWENIFVNLVYGLDNDYSLTYSNCVDAELSR